eukprot:CAMPEP_0171984130 /NCGR_PEP_ID=MMETSP0993-20121228/273664_1 /TAXON_ID=483369 /ORGANISM="non described non described, Strain CCMP2098" /LENGTH=507 /DNA_ID=CAMNT_0012636935 /DNA_START=66 /DNA_END=1585 /DNA_ORIENTATION=+
MLFRLIFLGTVLGTDALFYLPGVAPQSYGPREKVKLLVNKLTSTHTQIPYDYYSLPFCHPHIHEEAENLGERLTGDRIENSLYKLEMKRPMACEIVCRKVLSKFQAKTFVEAIDNEYRVHWIVDNLPSATVVVNELAPDDPYFTRGFPVGFKAQDFETGKDMHYLYNHIRIIVAYNEDHNPEVSKRKFDGQRVVGFRVEPFSIRHVWDDHSGPSFDKDETLLKTCNAMTHAINDPANYMSVDHPSEVIFTYDVVWEESEVSWANRWDVYLKGNPDDKIHWFSITNSTMIVVFLTVMVAMILVRTLNSDIAQYNDPGALEDAKEESGWKLCHEDHNPEVSKRKFDGQRVVGFRVEPFSIRHVWDDHSGPSFDKDETLLKTCNAMTHAINDPANYMSVDHPSEVIFTYDVVWEESEVSWANRWDVYLKGNPDDKIHWFSITNSTMIVVFLTVMVAMILVRTLNSDIAQYNDPGALEDAKEESGWKLCHADVFRAPAGGKMLLSVLVGTG